MTAKRFTQRLYETGERFLEDNETDCFYKIEDSFGNVELLCERLNKIVDENEQLKQQLKEEQLRTTPIVLNTHISDDDFKRIEAMIVKHFEKR